METLWYTPDKMNLLFGFISIASSIIALIFLLAFFMALFKSKKIVNEKTTRGKAIAISVILFFVFASLAGATEPKDNTPQKTTVTTATVNTAQTTKDTQQPTKVPLTPTATPTPVPTDANGFPMYYQAVTVAQIAKVPSAYNGKIVMFDCTVSTFVKGDNGDATGFNCSDPNDYSSLLQVQSGKVFDYTQINEGDTVKIYGLGGGAGSGQNAYGGNVTEAVVGGVFINDATSGYSNTQ